jgi:hypothetical protein
MSSQVTLSYSRTVARALAKARVESKPGPRTGLLELVIALVGWVVAVVGGAVILVTLEYQGVVSRSTSDGLDRRVTGEGLGS